MRVDNKCPYDPKHKNTGIIVGESGSQYAVCPICKRSARVSIANADGNGTKYYVLSRTGKPPLPSKDKRKIYQKWLNEAEVKAILAGKARLIPLKGKLHLVK